MVYSLSPPPSSAHLTTEAHSQAAAAAITTTTTLVSPRQPPQTVSSSSLSSATTASIPNNNNNSNNNTVDCGNNTYSNINHNNNSNDVVSEEEHQACLKQILDSPKLRFRQQQQRQQELSERHNFLNRPQLQPPTTNGNILLYMHQQQLKQQLPLYPGPTAPIVDGEAVLAGGHRERMAMPVEAQYLAKSPVMKLKQPQPKLYLQQLQPQPQQQLQQNDIVQEMNKMYRRSPFMQRKKEANCSNNNSNCEIVSSPSPRRESKLSSIGELLFGLGMNESGILT